MCDISESQIKEAGQTIGKALESIATLLKTENPTVSADLTTAAEGLIAVTSEWTTGSSKAVFDDAANAVEEVLALIPETAQFAPFVAIAVAALDLLIANIGTPPAPITTAAVKATMDRIEALPPNPYRGKAKIIHHHGNSLAKDFVDAWNAEQAKQPTLGVVTLSLEPAVPPVPPK
jgi:hypothetical protein